MTLSRILGTAVAAALGLLPIAPPEHVHDHEEEGHHHAVIHRHAQPHSLLGHVANQRQHPTVEDPDDDPVLTLSAVYTVPAPSVVASPPPIVVAVVAPPSPGVFHRRFDDLDILIHGPPRAPRSLRGPPLSPAL